MITLRTRIPNRRPIISASLCLLAVVLLYAPFAVAAWPARSMACCTEDHCPIPEHHHRKAPAAPSTAEDCGHNMSGLTACTMSCCHPNDHPLVVSIAFLLPSLASVPVPIAVTRSPAWRNQLEFSSSAEPPSPPPRLSAAAL